MRPLSPRSTQKNTLAFARYIGIDYSGAETPDSSLRGLRVYQSCGREKPFEIQPPAGPKKYWTRRGIAHWMIERLSGNVPTIIGVDHGFSFPLRYFEAHRLEPDWDVFLDDFERHWPTGGMHTYVDFVRYGMSGNGAARQGNPRWRRLAEQRSKGAKSVFHFDVPGSVAKSTHAGLPWLRFVRRQLGARVHFWPFDGWEIPAGKSAVAEVYPALWSAGFPPEDRSSDQHDAYAIAATLSGLDRDGTLSALLAPALTAQEQAIAKCEGWILGVA